MRVSIQIKLSEQEVNTILQVLGQQPTSTGLWPLAVNIKMQAEAALKKTDEVTEAESA